MIRGATGPKSFSPDDQQRAPTPAGDRISRARYYPDRFMYDVLRPPQAQGRHPTHRHPHRLATGPPALATHHDPSLESRAGAPDSPHPSARPETRASAPAGGSRSHIMMGLEGQASTHHLHRGHGFWGTAPLHWIRRLTRHQKRELSWNTPPATATQQPQAFSVFIHTGRVIPHTTDPQAEPYIPKQEAGKQQQAEKPTRKKPKRNQPEPTASR